jgi:histidinol-phosphatase
MLAIDPIDGTSSYVLGLPMFGSLLSLLIDGEPVFGCIHLPALRETTFAASGHGCWCSHAGARPRRVHVGAPRRLSQAKVGMTCVKERSWLDQPGGLQAARLARRVGRLRMVGGCVQGETARILERTSIVAASSVRLRREICSAARER